ncbi:MAG TPA: hypothetical protein ENI51_00395 [Candidatus Atribacteria bacterium]|nr:hypothetical protein [Candidatus Atribacteria bacterium]
MKYNKNRYGIKKSTCPEIKTPINKKFRDNIKKVLDILFFRYGIEKIKTGAQTTKFSQENFKVSKLSELAMSSTNRSLFCILYL